MILLLGGCATGLERNQAGVDYYRKNMLSEAETEFKAAIEENSRNGIFYQNLGDTYCRQGHFQKAIGQYEEGVKLRKEVAIAYQGLARACRNGNRLDRSLEAYRKMVELKTLTFDHYTEFMEVAWDSGVLESEMEFLNSQLKEKTPTSVLEAARYSGIYAGIMKGKLLQGKYEEVVTGSDELLSMVKDFKREDGGNVIPIITPFFFSISKTAKNKLHPDVISRVFYSLRGQALNCMGKNDESIDSYKKGIQEQANNVEININLGKAYLQKDNIDEALYHFRKASEKQLRYREYIVAKLYYASTLAASGRMDDAETEKADAMGFVKHIENFWNLPSCSEIAEAMAFLELKMGRHDEARAMFEKVLQINPISVTASHYLTSKLPPN
jgi:tetratricopeptide (TPR) repeat protein